MTKKETLVSLSEALSELVDLLHLDIACKWTGAFGLNMVQALRLLRDGFTAQELADLSTSIRQVYQGMGSFNDYSPGIYDARTGRYKIIPGTEKFDVVSQRVYDLALRLVESDVGSRS